MFHTQGDVRLSRDVVLELASLTRCVRHDADRFERAIVASFIYNQGLLTVAGALHTRVESKWTRKSKIALMCTISVPSQLNALNYVFFQVGSSEVEYPAVVCFS